MICTRYLAKIPIAKFQNCLKFQITYNNFEISLQILLQIMLLPILIKLEAPSDTRLQKKKIPGQKGGPGSPGPTPKSALVFVQAGS